ncbi:MAG: efflux RND transporter periplasmic adaptor subunit [Thermogutta sp.]|nr:efflux RND transporter periplasmic adaptor subunit [Thermogutta sp.]
MKITGALVFVKKVVPFLLGIVVLVGVILWLSGFFNETVPPGRTEISVARFDPAAETVEPVDIIRKPVVEEAVGTIRAAERTTISSRIMSTIEKIHVRAGSEVSPGDVLIELDRAAVERQLNQAQASLTSAEAALKQAQDDYDRAVRLRQQNPGALSEQQFNEFKTRLDQAQANVEKARQAVAEIEVNLSYCTIAATRKGKIVDRLAEEGDTVSPGVPLLTLYDPSTLRLEVPIIENLATRLAIGDRVRVYIDALDREIEGTVDEKVPQADSASRTVLVKIALPETPGLVEGMFGRVKLEAAVRDHLCIPIAAVRRVGQLEFVDVVREDGTKERRLVQTGRLGRPGHTEVLSGVRSGEKVAVPKGVASEAPEIVPASGASNPQSSVGAAEPEL